MTGTGLKKWRPPNRSFLSVTLAISVMGRDDVLLANSVVLREEGRERERERDRGREERGESDRRKGGRLNQ